MIGAAGAVVASRTWPAWQRTLTRLEAAAPAIPAIVWTVLILLRLVVGPLLPRP